ncbi:M16 family metallopeptidase [Pseudodesulfovibrio aespoeensis]|uniref:M16 family metallopeptidase n=1 Tax=Pseudodesulfovibrio aespoeensis TaxID=182210 RepID=UPI002357AA50|nr:pitrilysin family protein [Pseudodesulfovibrio aespoeensis]MCG2731758.1 insulinase family protein [Pseudodesulfovibrio aespoeensis]
MFKKILLLGGLIMVLTGCQMHTNKKNTAAARMPALPSLAERDASETHIVRLENGLTVLIRQDDRFPLVNARLYVHAGSGYETPQIAGISHLLEHMVFKGTKKRGPGQSARDIEAVGGSMNAATSFDYTVYYVEVPDDQWSLGLDVITDMAFNAAIDPEELRSEKQVVLEELERGEDTPGSRLFKTLQGMVWQGSTYEWPIIGYRDTVSAMTDKDIHAYIAENYQPQSMLLAVVGKVNPDEVLAEARRLLGGLRNTRPVSPPDTIAVPATGSGPRVTKLTGKWNKVYLGATFPIPQGSSAKIAGLGLLCQLMGGDDTSRLYRTFKYDKQLVDDISISPLSLERGGMLYLSATLDADKLETFWTELMAELARFNPEDFTDREIERARLNLEDSLFLTKETLSGLASKLGYFQFFENGEQAEQNYLFALGQTGRAELKGLYDEFVRPDQLAACILTPEDTAVTPEALTAATHKAWPAKARADAKQQAATTDAAQQIALPGGNTLVLLPDETLPYTAVSIYWTGGDGDLTPDQQGLAALTAKALTRGTMTMSATDIQDFLSDHAASIGSSAGRNTFALEAKFPTRFTDKVLPLLRDTLTAPAFDQSEIDRARQDQIAAIKQREDQPLGLAFRHIFPFLYKTGPYALLHQGTIEGVEAMTQADIMRYWGRQSMHPFVFAVCGQFDRQAIEEFAASLSRTLTAPGSEYQFATPEWNTGREITLHLPDRSQSHLIMAFPAPGRDDRDTSARLELLKAILSGQSGLLFRDLRDKQGLAYSVTSLLWQSHNTGFLGLYIGTQPDKVDQSLAGFRTILADLAATPLPEAELERARNILTGDYYQEHQSLISRSREAASLLTQGFDREYDQDIIERAKLVTPQDIRELARHYLTQDKAYLMQVTP